MKGRKVIIPISLQKRAPDQLHGNHTGIEITRLLAHVSICLLNINSDIENAIKNCIIHLDFVSIQAKGKTLSYEISGRAWECVGIDSLQ